MKLFPICTLTLIVYQVSPIAEATSNETLLIGIGNPSSFVECSSQATIRCHAIPNSAFVTWTIDYSIELNTSLSARCFANIPCIVFNNYTGRYHYDFESSSGISNLNITHVNLEDDNRKYKCSDNNTQSLNLSVYTLPVVAYYETLLDGSLQVSIRTTCFYPHFHFNVEWYSTTTTGTDYKPHNKSVSAIELCTAANETDGTCAIANKSQKVINVLYEKLVKNNAQSPNRRNISVIINYFSEFLNISKNITFNVGSYIIQDSAHTPDNLSTGQIIGIAFGALGFVGLIVISIFAVVKCKVMKCKDIGRAAPDTPNNFTVDKILDTNASFGCTPAVYATRQEITLCCISAYCETDEEITVSVEVKKGGQPIIVTATGLKPNHQYRCYVFSVNRKQMRSKTSEELFITTLGKPDPPADVKEQEEMRTSSSITIQWKAGKDRRKPLRYIIEYGLAKKKLERVRWKEEKLLDDPRRESMSYTINGLQQGKKYIILVAAHNDFGTTEMTTSPLLVQTNCIKEGRPTEDEGTA